MKFLNRSVLAMAVVAASLSAHAGWDELEKDMSLDASDLLKMEVSAGAGDLKIVGDDNAKEITVTAVIVGEDVTNDDYELYLRKHGERAYLYAHFDRENNNEGYIDVTVTVPSELLLRVKDKSGNMSIKGMDSDISVTDGSGDIKIYDIAGNVKLKDGSGKTAINTIGGDLDIRDGSGDIKIDGVSGSVSVDDGSGDIRIASVEGNLDVDDSSGDVEVYTVSGEVTMRDSSGDIMVDTADAFSLISDGSGDVEIRNVRNRSNAG